MNITIAVDAMGGDFGPEVTIPASLTALTREPALSLVLVGQRERLEPVIQPCLDRKPELATRVRIQHASEIVSMDEAPAQALRRKKDSSMRVAVNLLKQNDAQACVSAGNTGALMATARFVLKTLAGIDRPAMISKIPSLRGHVHMLDLGANVDSPAHLLFQFAVMGSILVKYTENQARPSVGLLNIGVEDIKGNYIIKQAAELMQQSNLNYHGYVEGDAIYTGDVDLIVCDGFDGNVVLKTSEGLAQMIGTIMGEEFRRNPLTKLSALLAAPVMKAFRKRIDHRRYNGATLLGLHGIVVKSHGGADALAFTHAILQAVKEVRQEVVEHIGMELTQLQGQAS